MSSAFYTPEYGYSWVQFALRHCLPFRVFDIDYLALMGNIRAVDFNDSWRPSAAIDQLNERLETKRQQLIRDSYKQ